ncbi:MAG: ComEC/Rec2 family competence protein, partial [Bacillota bacterium]
MALYYLEQRREVPAREAADGSNSRPELSVLFIDVGQADSTLVSLSTGETMLIDAGEAPDADAISEELDECNITDIDILVATHPHSDHIGGMCSVIEHYDVGRVLMPDMAAQSAVYKKLMDAIHSRGIPVTEAYAGYEFSLGSAKCTVVSPDAGADTDANNESVAMFLDFNNSEFLFTGDMEEWAEDAVLDGRYYIDADVLKVAHHGSSTGSSQTFLSAVTPQYAVISCGTNNEYGHPHQETLERLTKAGATVYRTDQAGDVLILTDGQTLTVQTG